MRKILITGATGKIGSAFIAFLSASLKQWQLIIDTRNPQGYHFKFLKKMIRHPIEALTLNFQLKERVSSLEGLIDVFVITPFSGKMDIWHKNLVELLRKNDVLPKVVKVSVTGAKNPLSNPEVGQVPAQHWLGEQMFRDAGWPTVSIRPNIFMQHFMMNTGLYSKGANEFYLPFQNTKVSWLDCNDIALCAYHLFTNNDKFNEYVSKAFELSGPEAISPKEMQYSLSLLLNEDVKHHSSMEEFERHCTEIGVSDRVKHFYKEAGGGWFSDIHTGDFENITGQRPRNFARFLWENQYWFMP